MHAKLPSPQKTLNALKTNRPAVSWKSRDMGSKTDMVLIECEPADMQHSSTIWVMLGAPDPHQCQCPHGAPQCPTVPMGVWLWSLRICWLHVEPRIFYQLPSCDRASVTVACEVPSGDKLIFMSRQACRNWWVTTAFRVVQLHWL